MLFLDIGQIINNKRNDKGQIVIPGFNWVNFSNVWYKLAQGTPNTNKSKKISDSVSNKQLELFTKSQTMMIQIIILPAREVGRNRSCE